LLIILAHALLAEEQEFDALLAGDGSQDPGDVVRLGLDDGRISHQDGPVGAHGQRVAHHLAGILVADGDDDHLALTGLLLELQRGFDGELVIRRDDEGHAVEAHLPAVGRDPDPGFRVGNLLDADSDFHATSDWARDFRLRTA